MTMSNAETGLLGLLAVSAGIGTWCIHRFTREIKARYPKLYDDLGRPGLFAQMSIRNEFRFNRFILSRRYSSLTKIV